MFLQHQQVAYLFIKLLKNGENMNTGVLKGHSIFLKNNISKKDTKHFAKKFTLNGLFLVGTNGDQTDLLSKKFQLYTTCRHENKLPGNY